MPIKSVVIQFGGNLILGLAAIISLFVISLQNLNSFIFFFGLGYLGFAKTRAGEIKQFTDL